MPFDGLPPGGGGGGAWRLLFNIEAPGSFRTMPIVLADAEMFLVGSTFELGRMPEPEEEQPGHVVLRWRGSSLLDLKLSDKLACQRLLSQIQETTVNALLTVKLAAVKPDLTESQTFLVTGRVIRAAIIPERSDLPVPAPAGWKVAVGWKVVVELAGPADER